MLQDMRLAATAVPTTLVVMAVVGDAAHGMTNGDTESVRKTLHVVGTSVIVAAALTGNLGVTLTASATVFISLMLAGRLWNVPTIGTAIFDSEDD